MESGWYISPVLGEGNIQGLPGCFSCSCRSSSTADWGIEIFRTEFSVFGRLMVTFRCRSPTACLLTEMVRSFLVQVGPEQGGELSLTDSRHQSPDRTWAGLLFCLPPPGMLSYLRGGGSSSPASGSWGMMQSSVGLRRISRSLTARSRALWSIMWMPRTVAVAEPRLLAASWDLRSRPFSWRSL